MCLRIGTLEGCFRTDGVGAGEGPEGIGNPETSVGISGFSPPSLAREEPCSKSAMGRGNPFALRPSKGVPERRRQGVSFSNPGFWNKAPGRGPGGRSKPPDA